MRGQYFSSGRLEHLANELLDIYDRKKGAPIEPPIESDLVAERVGLDILWEEISEGPGHTICAEIRPEKHLIVVNERRYKLIMGTPGFYNTTVGHELGHWWLHVDHSALDHSILPDIIYSSAPSLADGRDERDEHNAHEFMSYLLMPRTLLMPRAAERDLQSWRDLYRLREEFGVTISAMKTRLEKLGLTYLDDNGRFHKSRQEAQGQSSLF